jgi:hypothetical protein
MTMKRTTHERERDRERVAELYLGGHTYREIAEILSSERDYTLVHSTVLRDMKVVEEQWRERATKHLSDWKAQELARIDKVERAAWEAWERSIGQHEVCTEKSGGQYGPERQVKTEELAGDPRYLDKVAWCVSERCKILGLYAPAQTMLAADVTTRVDPIDEIPEERKLELIRQCLAAAESEHEAVDDGAADDDDGGSG